MRSTEEMKRLVHREAAQRRARRRVLLAGGVGALVLVLITATTARSDRGDSAEVAAGPDGAPPTSVPGTTASSIPDLAPPSTVIVLIEETGETVVIAVGDAPVTTSPRSTTTPPAAPRPTVGADPGPDDPVAPTSTTSPAVPTTRPEPIGGDGAPPPTPPTTDAPVRTCTADDIVRAPIQVFVPSAAGWTGGAIPPGHVVQFGYSTLARSDITPCRTPDSLQVLSITDATGAEVFRHTYDGGPGRVITPGTWVMFRGSVSWDPSCATSAPPAFLWACSPVGAGSFQVHLTDQGVVYPAMGITIAP